jgi:hypothetical protein
MMTGRPLVGRISILAVIFVLGFLEPASADVATMDEFTLTRDGTLIFDDTFGPGNTLVGGTGAVLPSGLLFPDGSSANYHVMGTVTETGNQAILDTALGDHIVQPPPFFSAINLNDADLLTGPPSGPFSLTPSDTFKATGLFDLSVPPTVGGFYQLELSGRVASNMGNGDVLSMQVVNCGPAEAACGSNTGPFVRLQDANFANNTTTTIAEVPLDTSHQQILFELSRPSTTNDDVIGSYEYIDNGQPNGGQILGFGDNVFQNLGYTQAGFAQLAMAVPEPSSLVVLASSVFGLAWLRRRGSAERGGST